MKLSLEYMTTPTQVVCELPPLQGDQVVAVRVIVDDQRISRCLNCNFGYYYSRTPQIEYLIPNAGNPEQEIFFYGKQEVESSLLVDYFKIGDQRCDMNEQNEFNFQEFQTYDKPTLPCNVPPMEAGYYNVTQRNLRNTGLAKKLPTVPTYRFGGDSYDFVVVPRIDSISNNNGSIEGQIITIKGAGFSTTNQNEVSLGNVSCKILEQSATEITCEMPPLDGPIPAQGYHAGLKWEFYEQAYSLESVKNGAISPTWTKSRLVPEPPSNVDDNYAQKLSGYFKAPTTGPYRFTAAGDDLVEVYLSRTPLNTTALEKILDIQSPTPYKFYFDEPISAQISQEISLVADNFYYMEIYHKEYTAQDSVTVGAYIPNAPNDVSNPFRVQSVKINCPFDYEVVEFKISGAQSGQWKIQFNSFNADGSIKTVTTRALAYNIAESTLEGVISWDISLKNTIIKKMFTSTGEETANIAEAYTIAYNVTFITLRKSSLKPVIVSSGLVGTQVAVKVTQLQASSTAVTGTFTIAYGDESREIAYNIQTYNLEGKLRELGFPDPMRVVQVGDADLGAEWRIQYNNRGLRNEPNLTITGHSLSGCRASSPISVDITTLQESSNDLYYEVIPVDLLFTAEQNTQVTVKSNGVTANCPNFNCDYIIQENDLPTITSSSYVAPDLTLLLENVSTNPTTGLSYTAKDIRIFFANTECEVESYDATTSPVTLSAVCSNPEAGEYYPRVHFDGMGYAANGLSSKTVINPVISDVTPLEINPNGGTILTITGSGFPASLEIAEVRDLAVKVSETSCELTSVTPTQLQCITSKVQEATPLTISLNEKDVTDSRLSFLSAYPTITTVNPVSANPVLQTKIVISGTNFDSNKAHTKVLLQNRNTSKVEECLISTANTTTIECALLGASTGKYDLFVQTSLGYSNSQDFNVKTVITSLTPTYGSMAGGTILTIQGGDFSTDIQQSMVLIGMESIRCYVIQASKDQIQCKTAKMDSSYANTAQEVVVATRIVEESVCEDDTTSCQFTYLASATPNVTWLSETSLTPGSNLHIKGTNLESDPSGILPIVTIGSKNCAIVENNDTDIIVTIPADIIPNKTATLAVNIAGKGDAWFSSVTNTIEVKPVLTSVSPLSGPSTGVLLTLTGLGFQPGVSVKVGTSLCKIRSLTSTQIICKATAAGKVSLDYNAFTNVNSSSTISLASAQTASVTSVSSLSFTAPTVFTLTIQGTQLNVGTVTINLISQSDTLFPGTILSQSSTTLDVSFSDVPAGSYNLEVISNPNIISISNTVTVPLSANIVTPIESSIGGGALLMISGSGFFDNAEKDKNTVTVCGLTCDILSSTPTSLECLTPLFINPTVMSTYSNLATPSALTGVSWSDHGNETTVFDLAFTTTYQSPRIDCYIGLDIGAHRITDLTEVRFFPDPALTGSILSGTLIEGSNDNITYITLATIDENAYDGWNTIRLDDESTSGRFRYYRLRGSSSSAKCALAELQFYGVVQSDSVATDLDNINCAAQVTVGNQIQTTASAITYRKSKTATLTSINPQMGTTAGGTDLILTGDFLQTDVSKIKVYIDDVECAVSTATSTQINCITGPAPSIPYRRSSLQSEIKIQFEGSGFAIVNGTKYFYIDRWSDENTWGGIAPPREGESVSIPSGQTILLDVSPPKLKAIIIEGTLIFEDKDLDLHCEYILVRNGRLQIGTPEKPIQNKITITVYGEKFSPPLPTFGNKVIALMEGILDIHGKPRSHTWTVLDTTAAQSATSIAVRGQVDWQVGEQIVIASTDHDHYQSESRTIANVVQDSPTVGVTTITFVEPLKYKHYAGVQALESGVTLEMRAEVGLLTRNVVIQGDESSEKTKYGVHIIIHSRTGDDKSIGRITYAEVRRAGQAYNVGRYAIHFHMTGNVRQSYVVGNSIHHSYNRAITVHGVHYLKVQKNVAYWVMGHTIFIEDGIETHNVIEDNLVINTIASQSLLNTDMTPASFWITHPNNMIRRNHAAGSDRYGFWYDLKPHPEGPSATTSVCPRGEKLGEFTDNEAHSNGRYGLMIFPELIPRTYPCKPYAPYYANPYVQAEFKNFVGWKNIRSGVIGERNGALKFKNIKTADNMRGGIEITDSNYSPAETLVVEDAWIVGTSENAGDHSIYIHKATKGLITSRDDYLVAKGIHFYNFGTKMTAIETCSHCEFTCSTDSGARTTFFERLTFNNVTQRVRFNVPYKEILVDRDGSLTEAGSSGVVTFFYNHLNVPGCTRNEAVFNGLVCDQSVIIRRTVIYAAVPYDNLGMQAINISRIDNGVAQNASSISFRAKERPNNNWAIPFVTGQTYSLYWANRADFDKITIDPSSVYRYDDAPITLIFNHSEYREKYQILAASKTTDNTINITNSTALWTNSVNDPVLCGDWYHDTMNQKLYLAINGKERTYLNLKAFKCYLNCPNQQPSVVKEGPVRLWSNASQWPNQQVPQDGDDVIIPADWTLLLDVNTSSLSTLTILGDLYFDPTKAELVLTAERIWVQGQLIIGNNTDQRYQGKARIVLTGKRNSASLIIGPTQSVSNKVLAVTGNLTLYGKMVNNVYTRLQAPAEVGTTSIRVPANIDWKVGDEIVIAPSEFSPHEFEARTIKQINNGIITFDQPLEFYHFGANDITKTTPYGSIDMRTEVGLLTRNIIIEGTDIDNWGGRIYVGEIYNTALRYSFRGRVELDGVETKNLGQADTNFAGLTFERLKSQTNDYSIVRRCVMRNSGGIQLRAVASDGISFENNILYLSMKYQVSFEEDNSHIQFLNNLIVGTKDRGLPIDESGGGTRDATAALSADVHFEYSEFSGNIFAGVDGDCVVTPGVDCTNQTQVPIFRNNTAHSGRTGWVATPPTTKKCNSFGNFTGYKLEVGVSSYFESPRYEASNIVITDTMTGLIMLSAGSSSSQSLSLKNSYIGGLSFTAYSNASECSNFTGVLIPSSTTNGKKIPMKISEFPMYKIKYDHVWQSTFIVKDVIFENFKDNLVPGCNGSHLFKSNHYASDASSITTTSSITLRNVARDNIVYFENPGDDMIDTKLHCGGFFCTGITNILLKDIDGTLTGSPTTLIPNNPTAQDPATCTFSIKQNAYVCQDINWGMLTFESLDEDKFSRSLAPITVLNNQTYSNVLNSYMDHKGVAMYASQLRLSRFHAVLPTEDDYTVLFSGTVPSSLVWQLQGAPSDERITLEYRYEKPNSVRVTTKTNPSMKPVYTTSTEQITLKPTDGCGAHMYNIDERKVTLQLTSDEDCLVYVNLTNSIRVTLRFSIEISEFFQQNGPISFIDKVAAVLKINPASIRIVDIRSGSTIIQAFIDSNHQDTTSESDVAAQAELNQMIITLREAIDNGDLNILNSTVLNSSLDMYLVRPLSSSSDSSTEVTQSGSTFIIIAVAVGVIALVVGSYFAYRRFSKKRVVPIYAKKVKVDSKIHPVGEHPEAFGSVITERPLAFGTSKADLSSPARGLSGIQTPEGSPIKFETETP